MAGNHLSKVLGISAEFTEYRAYRQGDDVNRIDWKLLARSNRAYVRLSNDRTVLSTMLLVDASASLAYPSATMEKWHFARQVTIALASAAHRGSDPVGLLIATDNGPRHLQARSRRGVVSDIARVLDEVTPTGSPEMAPILPRLRSSGRVAIISDFLGDADALLKVAGQLCAAGREVHAVHILHGNEVTPSRHSALVTDPENDTFKRPMTDTTRRRYMQNFGEWREELARSWRLVGAYYTAVATTETVANATRRVTMPNVAVASGTAR
jgi:uncharacterized protein (DUF58 family)